MTDEDTGALWRGWPEGFRRVLDRLDRHRSLPAAAPPSASLGPGTATCPPEAEIVGEREPVTDVIVGLHSIFVTIELPGVERKDIDLRATATSLVVSASSPLRKYHREILLPRSVRVDMIHATYKNGVLDVALGTDVGTRRDPVQ